MDSGYSFKDARSDLLSPLETVRERAVKWLALSGEIKAIPLLKRVISTDNSARIRFIARKCLHDFQDSKPEEHTHTIQSAINIFEQTSPRIQAEKVKRILQGNDLLKKQNLLRLIARKQLVSLLDVIIEVAPEENDPILRSNMVIIMGVLGNKKTIKTIATYLKDTDPRVRANAIEALEFTGDPNAYPIVVNALGDQDNRIRANAIKALRNYGKINCIALLRKMLKSTQIWMRESAAYALSIVARDEALPLLIELLIDSVESIRKRAAEGIATLAEKGDTAADSILEQLATVWPDKNAAPSPVDLRHLFDTGSSESLEHSLDSMSTEDKVQYIRTAMENHDKSRLVNLITLAQSESDDFIKANAIIALGKLGDEHTIDVLSDFLASTKDRVRANAIEALATIGGKKVPPLLVGHLDDPNNRCRANAVIGLKEHPYFDIVKPLKTMVSSEVVLMRKSALYAISDIGTPEMVPVLEILCTDKDESIRSEALKLMKMLAHNGMENASSVMKLNGENDANKSIDELDSFKVSDAGFLDFDSAIDFEVDFAPLTTSERPLTTSQFNDDEFIFEYESDDDIAIPMERATENIFDVPSQEESHEPQNALNRTIRDIDNKKPAVTNQGGKHRISRYSPEGDTNPPDDVQFEDSSPADKDRAITPFRFSIQKFFTYNKARKKEIIEELKNEITLQSFLFLREAMQDRDFEIKVFAKMALKNFDSDDFDIPDANSHLEETISHSKPVVEIVEYSGYHKPIILSRNLNEKAALFETTHLWQGPFDREFPILNALREDTIDMLNLILKEKKIRRVQLCFQQSRLKQFIEGKKTLDGNRYANVISLSPVINRIEPYSPTATLLKELKRPIYLLSLLTDTRLILFLRGPLETSFAKYLAVPYSIIEDLKIVSTMDKLQTIVLHIYGDFVEIPELYKSGAKELYDFINEKKIAGLKANKRAGQLDPHEELKKLETLKNGGSISEKEYNLRKSRIRKVLKRSGVWDGKGKIS